MTSPMERMFRSTPPSRQSREPKQAADTDEPVKKPKKVNSEVRKQQNRIASRNYREKRKRKLQYLQQLVKDGPDDQLESEPSPGRYEEYERSISGDYESTRPSSSPYMLPSTIDVGAMHSNMTTVSEALSSPPSAAHFDSQLQSITQAYSSFETNWQAPVYSPPPAPNLSWDMPSWTPNMDYYGPVVPVPETYNHNPMATYSLEGSHSRSEPNRRFFLGADSYSFDSALYGPQSQAMSNPNVSRPASSSYHQASHYQPH